MRPQYSLRATRGLARLKRHFNDIEIFVEDTKNVNMWVELIRRIIPAHIRLKSVNQLGGRDRVIAACKADQSDDGRRKLYIIDGDFDHILGKLKPAMKFLYRLKAYCLENIFISESSVKYVGAASKPDCTEQQIVSDFSFQNWHASVSRLLIPLFRAYAVAHSLAPSMTTTGYSVTNFYDHTAQGPTLSKEKIGRHIIKILRHARQSCAKEDLRRKWREVKNNSNALGVSQCVSGKDYLFPIFHLRMCKVLSFRGTPEQLKVHLARAFDPKMEPWLCRRLRALCV